MHVSLVLQVKFGQHLQEAVYVLKVVIGLVSNAKHVHLVSSGTANFKTAHANLDKSSATVNVYWFLPAQVAKS